MNNTGPSGLAQYALWAHYDLVVMNGRGVENYRRGRAELRKLADSAEPRERVKIDWIGPAAAAPAVAAKARWHFTAPANDTYTFYANIPADDDLSTGATYRLLGVENSPSVTVDQSGGDNNWV